MTRPHSHIARTLAVIAALALQAHDARAAEVCGNALDDDGDGQADEGCYPTLTTGQCESPLSCTDTGSVSPTTGSLHYSLPPDIAPGVPWGPGVGLRRFYTSMYTPESGAPVWKTPLGPRWQHTYMTWITDVTAGGTTKVILHSNRGQDILLAKTSSDATWEYFTPTPGVHFKAFKRRIVSPFDYEIVSLTGDILTYSGAGRLTAIKDSLSTPNVVSLTYDGNGQLSTVVDASGKRRLLFGYANNVTAWVKFELLISGSWGTQHTTTYGYTSGNLTDVHVGGTYVNNIAYTSNYVTSISDGQGKVLVSFVYDGTTPGKVVRVDTPRGMVGWEYAASRTSCSGTDKTVLYFHRGNTTSCSIDSDCGSGFLCGGKTGTGATGVCFRAARCLTTASPSEDVVTTVAALGPPGESCDGACLDTAEYIWNTGSGVLDLGATEDPSASYTVQTFDANGMPTKIVYGDVDSNPSNGNGKREVYLSYDTTFPGRVTEMRRKSDLEATGLPCTSSDERGCQRTLYAYTTDGLLDTVQQLGYTRNTSGIAGYDYVTSYDYDTKGRITQISGPLSGSETIFEYTSSSSPIEDGFLEYFKRKKDATNYLVQSALAYDFWGHATTLQDADGSLTCLTFHTALGHLIERREAMNGQTDCSTPHSSDLITTWTRDSSQRLTKVVRPDGSCMHYLYDSRGRLSQTKRRDDCNVASSGDFDFENYTYSDEGLLTKIETKDASTTVTRRKELTYYDSRRLEKMINPVNTAKWTGLTYEDRGLLSEVAAKDATTNFNRTAWTYDEDARVTGEKRYTAGSSFDTWSLLFDWGGNQKQVTDGDAKVTQSERDDLGRVVRLISPDLGGYPTLRVYDAANRIVFIRERDGGSGYKEHAFTYDLIGRPLNADYAGSCQDLFGLLYPVPDIVRVYDAVPGGAACPITGGCNNLVGRLAYVKVKLMCASAAGSDGDWTIEQETYYSYDAAGRVIAEHLEDDSTSPKHTADQAYEWTQNGALAKVTMPSSTVIGWTFGSTGSNSDSDLITAMWRTNTSSPIADQIQWMPYGPLKQYNQQNTSSTLPLRTVITRNLAYRITKLEVELQSAPNTDLHYVLVDEDEAGRTKKRIYFPSPSGIQDSWFKYDQQDRVLCETTSNPGSSCPTSGSTIKNSHTASPPFTAAGDWKQLKRPIPGSSDVTHDFTLASGTHQIAEVEQPTTLQTTTIRYNTLGNRSEDDNEDTLTYDERLYSYDARRNVTAVTGKFYTGSAWHDYAVVSAFDQKNRRVFKSFTDTTTGTTATWFFYYDPLDRLTEIRHTPNVSSSSTYSTFQLFWLGNRLVLYWQTDYPSATTSKRYVGTDETNRPIDMICWGSGGANCPRVWSVNPDAWGFDQVLLGASVFQPILFSGQYKDEETIAWRDDGTTQHRPGVVQNGHRHYDPWMGSYPETSPHIRPKTFLKIGCSRTIPSNAVISGMSRSSGILGIAA